MIRVTRADGQIEQIPPSKADGWVVHENGVLSLFKGEQPAGAFSPTGWLSVAATPSATSGLIAS